MALFAVLSFSEISEYIFNDIKPRSIGPASMSGRISAIEAVIKDPKIIYAGTATGGVWKSEDRGITWNPIFDDQPVSSIGDVAIFQKNPNIIWVGTGEPNVRNSAGVGRGIYKSIDGGKTWEFLGLKKTERISKIVLHPDNSDIAYVAALGEAWGENSERGVYKTVDGGKSWKKILYVGEKTGAADIIMAPGNPNKLLAAMWQYRRWPWFFKSGGPGSGLYITVNGGDNWDKLNSENGLPKGELGRIGVAFAENKPEVVYALVEAERSELMRSEDGGYNWKTVNRKPGVHGRPFYYSKIRVNPKNENILYTLQGRLRASEDGGKSFKSIASFRQSHSDYHAMWINPDGENLVVGNDGGIVISNDRGKHWRFVANLPLGQYYHISYDMDIPYNVYGGMQDNGSWRGPNTVYSDSGIFNYHWKMVGFGDGFDTEPDPENNKCGYAMSQQGHLFYFNVETGHRKTIRPTESDVEHRYNWNAGFARGPFDKSTIYYGSQFVHKSEDKGRSWEIISPDLTTNDPSKLKQEKSGGLTKDVTGAENYETIVAIAPSPLKEGVIWIGTDDGNVQLKKDGGANWTLVSEYLVKKKMVPEGTWVPYIEASNHDPATAYVVFDDHRRSNWKTYAFVTHDYGKSWKNIATQEIDGFAHVIKEDLENKNLLFLGTEFGLFVSFNAGKNWIKWKNGFPTVPVRDIAIHPRENDLIVGTHGRSAYIFDDITPLREITEEITEKDIHLFDVEEADMMVTGWSPSLVSPSDANFVGENEKTGAIIDYYINPNLIPEDSKKESKKKKIEKDKQDTDKEEKKSKKKNEVKIEILDSDGEVIRTMPGTFKKGINRVFWDLRRKGFKTPFSRRGRTSRYDSPGIKVVPGDYIIRVNFKDNKIEKNISVKFDPRYDVDIKTLKKNHEFLMGIGKWMETITEAYQNMQKIRKKLKTILENTGDLDKEKKKTITQKIRNLDKKIEDKLYKIIPPRNKQGIFDTSDTLSRQIYSVYGSVDFEPISEQTKVKYEKVKKKLKKFIEEYNKIVTEEYIKLIQELKESEFTILKGYKELKI